jgi:hypothetical protein
MTAAKTVHPIKRIRESLKTTPEESGLRQFSSSQGFASWLGRSASLIRNVECGIMPKWERLAKLIETKTGVSSKWMLSMPLSTDPIIDVKGQPWNVSEWLDPLAGGGGKTPNWRSLLMTSPESVGRIVVRMVETQLRMELSKGGSDFLAGVITLLHNFHAFENPEFSKILAEAFEKETSIIMSQLWPHGDKQMADSVTSVNPGLKSEGGKAKRVETRSRTRIIFD